jgi:hypothetical protein
MRQLDEAEFLFEDEIRRLKKEKASLHEATKHKRLGKKNVRFASDLMSRGEKIKHRRAGKIMTTNLYSKVISFDEFKNLETHEQKNMMAYWRLTYDNKTIMKQMGLGNAAYYKIVAELGLPKATRTNKGDRKERKKVAAVKVVQQEATQFSLPETVVQQAQPVQEIIVNGMHLVFNGTYKPEMIVKQLLKFGALLEDEMDDYYIELKLVQKAAKG